MQIKSFFSRKYSLFCLVCIYDYFSYFSLSLSLESLEHVDGEKVNVVLDADFGAIVADVTLNVELNYFDNGDSEFFVDQVGVQMVEDENGEPMQLTYNIKELSDRIDILLHNLLERSFTSEDERQLIKAIN